MASLAKDTRAIHVSQTRFVFDAACHLEEKFLRLYKISLGLTIELEGAAGGALNVTTIEGELDEVTWDSVFIPRRL